MARRRRYNNRRAEQDNDPVAGIVASIALLFFAYGALKYMTDRVAFTRFVWAATAVMFAVFVAAIVGIVLYQRSSRIKFEKLISAVESRNLMDTVDNWILTIGRAKEKGDWWSHRGYSFTEDRISDFVRDLNAKGVGVSAANVKSLLEWRINERESKYVAAVGEVPLDEVNVMSGEDFEKLLARLFEAMGYSVSWNGKAGDQGADLICAKSAEKLLVQAKRWSSAVDNSAVQEAVAGKTHYGCTACAVVTNSTFTNGAHELAKTNGVRLIDGHELRLLLSQYLNGKSSASAESKKCPRCGGKLVERTSNRGPFLGCENFAGKGCRYTEAL